jgi:hypothetical protein
MRGDEHDGGRITTLAHERGSFDARQARHRDVEEHDVVDELAREAERLDRARGFAENLHLGMCGEQVAQLGARGRFVVHDQRANRHRRPAPLGSG